MTLEKKILAGVTIAGTLGALTSGVIVFAAAFTVENPAAITVCAMAGGLSIILGGLLSWAIVEAIREELAD